jgi:hypothetical protein
MPRFIILDHTGAPDDPAGRHLDLLLETEDACRTWRLPDLPQPGAQPVTAVEIAPHRLAWLDHTAGEVSAGRGFARRVDAGTYEISVSDATDFPQARHFTITAAGHTGRWSLQFVRHDAAWTVAAIPERFHHIAPGE